MTRLLLLAALATSLSGCSTCLSCLCSTLSGAEREPNAGQSFARELRPTQASAPAEAAPAAPAR